MSAEAHELIQAARAGRVQHTGFLEPDVSAALVVRLRQAEVNVHVWGGYPGARRRVITVYPESVPEATTPLTTIYAEGPSEQDFYQALSSALGQDAIGDSVAHQQGYSVVALAAATRTLPNTLSVAGQTVTPQLIPLDKALAGTRKRQLVVVPSLRVDALGAKAFGVSRAYFSKGIAAGNVTVNGQKATKSSSAEAGDEIYAAGLGRFYVLSVAGETRRGNLKVNIESEKS
jgi:RNA-binding protein YlmH